MSSHAPTAYYPEDTDTTIYVYPGLGNSLSELIERAKDKWGEGISLEKIDISTEYIQTYHVGHDLYDSSDYIAYITITNNG